MPIDECLVFSEIALHRLLCGGFVLGFDPAAFARDPLDEATPSSLKPRLSLAEFPFPALTLFLEGTQCSIALSDLRAS
ncbi:MAG: hypothetical protein AAF913_18805, partial [Pseudomonadota bacterium]